MIDYVLLIYSVVLGIIIIAPFFIFQKINTNENTDEKLLIERKMLMENLRDLKTDYETGKFSQLDFHTLSRDIIEKLETIDKKISPKIEKEICRCGEKRINRDSLFCHKCGLKF